LRREEQLAASLSGDWFMHVDADEIHASPRAGQTLADAFAEVEANGFNAVNFQEYTFTATREQPDHDRHDYLQTMRWYYPFRPFFPHRLNAWKRQPGLVNLNSLGGHVVAFPGLRMNPEPFIMRHYFVLSVDHVCRKFVEKRYAPEEVQRGWHRARATLRPEMISLPTEAELVRYLSDDQLDASNPRTQHLLFRNHDNSSFANSPINSPGASSHGPGAGR
jgi:hypothetical protein